MVFYILYIQGYRVWKHAVLISFRNNSRSTSVPKIYCSLTTLLFSKQYTTINFEQDFRNNRIKSWFTTFSFFHDHASHYKTSKQWFKQCDCPFTHHAIRFIHCSIFALSCKRLYNRRGIMCLQFANLAWIFCNSVSSFE